MSEFYGLKVDFVLPVKCDTEKRWTLLEQLWGSFVVNTPKEVVNRVVMVDDGSVINFEYRISKMIEGDDFPGFEIVFPKAPAEPRGVGGAKNHGVSLCDPRGQFLYLMDSDVYFAKDWFKPLYLAYMKYKSEFKILAGGVHPYLQPRAGEGNNEITSHDALSGWSWFMSYDVWDEYGKLADNAIGSGKSEDWEYCQRIRNAGFKVGCLKTQMIAHCGMTNTEGLDIPGRQESERLSEIVAPGVKLL